MNKECILVLDKISYKEKENEIIKVFQKKHLDVEIFYTEYEDDSIRKVRKWKILGSLLQHLLYWKKSYLYAKKIFSKKNNYIICINPIVGVFLGLMNINLKKDITLCGFLFELKKNKFYYELRKQIVKKSLNGIKYAIVYANQEVSYYERIFLVKNKFMFIPYGIDFIIEKDYLSNLPKEYIFSGGGSNRNYKTLVEAYNMLKIKDNIPKLIIATMPRFLKNLDISGINVLTDVVLETFGSVMKQSKFLILSLDDCEISAGHQVMLEALKNNVPIIVNRIKAVEDYVSCKEVIFYESGNSKMLASCINDCIKNKVKVNTNKIYNEKYTFQKFLSRLLDLV